jgi:hypothetical protein
MNVVETARPRPAAKYRSFDPPVSANASTITTVATTPDSTFTRTGVPNLGDIRPNQAGPAPSAQATA